MRAAGKPVIDGAVQLLQGGVVVRRLRRSDFGAASNANALALPCDGDLLLRVDGAGQRRMGGLAQRGADGVAKHRGHGQLQPAWAQQGGGGGARAQHHGVKPAHVGLALQPQAGGLAGQRGHWGVERKLHPGTLHALAQHLGKQSAVAGRCGGQQHYAVQWCFGRQARLQLARIVWADVLDRGAGFTQPIQQWLELRAVFGGAEKNQAAGIAFKIQFVARGKVQGALAAVAGQALQCCQRRLAAPPAPQPGQLLQSGALRHADARWCAAQQPGFASQCTGGVQVGGQQPGVCKAGFLGGGAALFQHGHFMAVVGQFVCGGHADDPGAHNGDLHGFE